VTVIEHQAMMAHADWIIDIGPGAGHDGGSAAATAVERRSGVLHWFPLRAQREGADLCSRDAGYQWRTACRSMLRACQPADAARISEIYTPFVRESVVTFEEEPVSELEMARRIREVGSELPWLVWEEAGRTGGYAAATRRPSCGRGHRPAGRCERGSARTARVHEGRSLPRDRAEARSLGRRRPLGAAPARRRRAGRAEVTRRVPRPPARGRTART